VNCRRLGRTGLEVSEVGYGTWGLGSAAWLGVDHHESLRALHRAMDLGVNLVDTALGYGDGYAEEMVGCVVRERNETVRVATKIPPKNSCWPVPAGLNPDDVFPGEWIRSCTERSLRNTGLDVLDLQQFHVWSDDWVCRGSWLEAVQRLKDEGKIRAFGVSINDHEPANAIKLVKTGAVDAVQVIYNVFDQSPEDELFGACRTWDVGVLARVPFDEGSLTGIIAPDTTFPAGDFRNSYFCGGRRQQVAARVQAIIDDLGVGRDRLAELALRYVLSHPVVSSAIPGMRSVRNVEHNVRAGDGKGLPKEQLARLKAHRWVRNFYTG
jgi:aryl-alcohol dehydrogenase-like predicted oxidoreductase